MPRGVKKGCMSRDEMLAECEWLLDGGMSTIYIAQTIGKSPQAIAKAAWRAGKNELCNQFMVVHDGAR